MKMNLKEVIDKIKDYRKEEQAYFNEGNYPDTLIRCHTMSLCDYVLGLLSQVNYSDSVHQNAQTNTLKLSTHRTSND